MSRVGGLLALQDLDSRLQKLHAEQAEVDAALRGDAELRRLQSMADERTASRDDARRAMRAHELEVNALRHRAADLERRLFDGSVGNPTELMGMQKELDALRERIGVEDERLLELMETEEAAADQATTAAQALGERRQGREQSLPMLRERAAQVKAALLAVESERDAATGGLSKADLDLYRRVGGRHQPAVVHLDGDRCGGCRHQLSVHEIREVRTGDSLAQCPNCDRILVP